MDALINYFIRKYPNNFISGTDDCNIIVIQDSKSQKFMLLLVIGVNYHPSGYNVFSMYNYIRDKLEVDIRFQQLYKFAEHIHNKNNTEIQIIGYPSLSEYAENNWCGSEIEYPFEDVKFYIHNKGINSKMISGEELKQHIYDVVDCLDSSSGTMKAQNSHISSYMQYWNRNFLAPTLRIVDIDGVFYNWDKETAALLEVKRSSYEPWAPYLSDLANYKLYCALSKNINSVSYYLLMQHHDEEKNGVASCDDDYKIRMYCVTGIDFDTYNNLKEEKKKNGNYLKRGRSISDGKMLTLSDMCLQINQEFLT